MDRFYEKTRWVLRNFFPLTLLFFAICYLRWLQLTPVHFWKESGDEETAIQIGSLLFSLYFLLSLLISLLKKRQTTQKVLISFGLLAFWANVQYLLLYTPKLENNIIYNDVTYYITSNRQSPFGYGPGYYQLSKWRKNLTHESIFFGYSGGPFKIIYDTEHGEVNFVNSYDMMVYTDKDREYSRGYEIGYQLDGHYFYPSSECISWVDGDCSVNSYTFYCCNLNNTSCMKLPVQYSGYYAFDINFEPNKAKNETDVYFDIGSYPGTRTLIFTYGDHPRCYVEGCEILLP